MPAQLSSNQIVFFLDTTSHQFSPITGGPTSINLNGFSGGGSSFLTDDAGNRLTDDAGNRITPT